MTDSSLRAKLTRQRDEADKDFTRTKEFFTGMVKAITTDLPGLAMDLVDKATGDEPKDHSKRMFEAVTGIKTTGSVTEQAGGLLDPRNLGKAMIVGGVRFLKQAHGVGANKGGKVLDEIYKLEKEGASRADIYDTHGVYRDLDGKLKAAIPDYKASVNDYARDQIKSGLQVNLDDILDHKELFTLYPELRDLPVTRQSGAGASFHGLGEGRGITIGDKLEGENAFSAILHEVQHAIQRTEDFKGGGNPAQFQTYQNRGAVAQKITDKLLAGDYDLTELEAIKRFKMRLDMDKAQAEVKYANVPGEQEARFTESTRNLDSTGLGVHLLKKLRQGVTPQSWDTRELPSNRIILD